MKSKKRKPKTMKPIELKFPDGEFVSAKCVRSLRSGDVTYHIDELTRKDGSKLTLKSQTTPITLTVRVRRGASQKEFNEAVLRAFARKMRKEGCV